MATLHPPPPGPPASSHANPLPQLLQTPTGLALLELQGTINLPPPSQDHQASHPGSNNAAEATATPVPIGHLSFPEHRVGDEDGTAWMRRAYLYVGQHQRLTGEVRKLPRPVAVVRRRGVAPATGGFGGGAGGLAGVTADAAGRDVEGQREGEELEVVEIVRYKIVFSQRPEPVGTG